MPRPPRFGIAGLSRRKDGTYCFRWRRQDGTNVTRVFPKGTNRDLAIAQAKKLFEQAATEESKPPPVKLLSTAIEEYFAALARQDTHLTKPRESVRRAVLETLGDVPITSLGAPLLRQWVDARTAAGKSASTVNKGLILLKAVTRRLVDRDELPESYLSSVRKVSKLREDNDRVRSLSDEERRKLLDACGEHLRDLVLAGMLTGARLGELLSVRVQDVDLKRGALTLRRSKTAILSTVPIHPKLAEVLKRLCDGHKPQDIVFRSSKGPWTTSGVTASMRNVTKRAGIEDFHFHDLRHDFATQLLSVGEGFEAIAGLLGHSKKSGLTMTSRYAHLHPDRLAAPVAKLKA